MRSIFAARRRVFLANYSEFLWKSCLDFVILGLLNCQKCKPTANLAPAIMTLNNYDNIQQKMNSLNRFMIHMTILQIPDFCSINIFKHFWRLLAKILDKFFCISMDILSRFCHSWVTKLSKMQASCKCCTHYNDA